MKRLLITGLSGTLAPRLAEAAAAIGVEVLAWDRQRVSTEDSDAARAWLQAQRPDAIAHLAMGSAEWSGLLAAYAAAQGIPFLFTSTVMVFDPDGPHAPDSPRTGSSDYGRYKISCEDAVLAANAAAQLVRIGWQIDAERQGNNMLFTLDQWQREQARVGCSRAWMPACSFMCDTAQALLGLLQRPQPGIHHLDSNAGDAFGFDRVAAGLKKRFGRDDWRIEVHEDYRHDQRLVGGAIALPSLSDRLPL
ncbi:sugar nucleotide-binding protein [Burkholderiaceae bacterium UC74_6]